MKKIDVILGLQWGDEGKGKIVDVLTPRYDCVARFQGGPNAGHSLHFGGRKFVLHTIPSGIFRDGAINIIGNGVVIDPVILQKEVATIEASGTKLDGKLLISRKAHLILPTHRILDAAQEASKGAGKIGSTLKGIGPTYVDKTGRSGLRMGDVEQPDFRARYERLRDQHLRQLKMYDFDFNLSDYEQGWFEALEALRRFPLIDSEVEANRLLDGGKTILAEGAQGSMLDVDFGTYPFVTSSNTTCAGVCTGLGIAPSRVGEVWGIFKAYTTRVGGGPFPTELLDSTGELMRQVGQEFGSTTGRPRRTGWLDLVALKYAVMINGATALIMMKADVLDDFDQIQVCTAYTTPDNRTLTTFPYEFSEGTQPVYRSFAGWKSGIGAARTFAALPAALKEYIGFIEAQCGIPVKIVSVGPDREQTIVR